MVLQPSNYLQRCKKIHFRKTSQLTSGTWKTRYPLVEWSKNEVRSVSLRQYTPPKNKKLTQDGRPQDKIWKLIMPVEKCGEDTSKYRL